jgi:exo-beta-1,3-glucanase (GH17 family)
MRRRAILAIVVAVVVALAIVIPTFVVPALAPAPLATPPRPPRSATDALSRTFDTSTAAARAQASSFAAFGMSQGFQPLELSDQKLATTMAGIAATGAKVVRLDLSWSEIQPTGPGDWQVANTLRVYNAARDANLTVLPVVSTLPAWVGARYPRSTSSIESFMSRIGAVLIPLGITTIELGNEVNLTGMTPAQYTRYILIPGSAAFRSAGAKLGATVTIVSSGLAPSKTANGDYSQRDFLAGIYAAGGGDYLDVVGTHPYTWPLDPKLDSASNWLKNTVQLRAVMVANGDSRKQIWATEFGYPTSSGSRGVTRSNQAKYLSEGAALWASYPWAGAMIFYSYQDLSGSASDPENRFGIVTTDGAKKPAWATLHAIMAG